MGGIDVPGTSSPHVGPVSLSRPAVVDPAADPAGES
jgi:hypothetical protein